MKSSKLTKYLVLSLLFCMCLATLATGQIRQNAGFEELGQEKNWAWFNPGWQPQAQLGDGKAPKAVQPSPNPSDLRLPRAMEPQINVTRNLTYLNHAKNCNKNYSNSAKQLVAAFTAYSGVFNHPTTFENTSLMKFNLLFFQRI